MQRIRVELAGVDRVDDVRQLWLELHRHHRAVAGAVPLVADDEASWEGDTVVGYAFVCIEHGPDDTFPVGDRYAELYSLSIAPDRRGRGIGTQLLDFVDRELARRSVRDLKVAVMAGNTDTRRFYERRGLRLGELVLYRFGSDGVQNAE
jgi:ribosomal protein S18 acetylase RimI-like enzyme